jgi:hypothetical protein
MKDFSSRAVAKLLAELPPIGMGIRVSQTALNDFRLGYRKRQLDENNRLQSEMFEQAALKILNDAPDPDAAF